MCLTTLQLSLADCNSNRMLHVSATGCCIVGVSWRGKAETWESGSTYRSDTCVGDRKIGARMMQWYQRFLLSQIRVAFVSDSDIQLACCSG
jgi:hypothetical protein